MKRNEETVFRTKTFARVALAAVVALAGLAVTAPSQANEQTPDCAWYQGSVDAPHISSGILRNTGQYEVITKARITCTPGVTLAAIQSELYQCQYLDRRPSPSDLKSCELGSSFAQQYENPTYETLYNPPKGAPGLTGNAYYVQRASFTTNTNPATRTGYSVLMWCWTSPPPGKTAGCSPV